MFGPGAYRPDPTEGITQREDLPAPQIMCAVNAPPHDIAVRAVGTVPIAISKSSDSCMTSAI